MKTIKLIITNLILVISLVILTSGMVFADSENSWGIEFIAAGRDEQNQINRFDFQISR